MTGTRLETRVSGQKRKDGCAGPSFGPRVLRLILCLAALVAFGSVAQDVEYPTGDACLFCHRNEIGSTWLENAHAWTIRPLGEPPALVAHAKLPKDATHVIGNTHYRALKKSGYGKFELLAADGRTWQPAVFEKQCAGCHTTAVNPKTGEFAGVALDCYTCHGNVPEQHTQIQGLALLSKTRKAPANEVLSICGSCHLRGGQSQTTRKPYPNAFVAGDDLFRDFKVDLKLERNPALDATDTHVYVKTRAVQENKSNKTCVDCHKIHGPPEARERDVRVFSGVCEY